MENVGHTREDRMSTPAETCRLDGNHLRILKNEQFDKMCQMCPYNCWDIPVLSTFSEIGPYNCCHPDLINEQKWHRGCVISIKGQSENEKFITRNAWLSDLIFNLLYKLNINTSLIYFFFYVLVHTWQPISVHHFWQTHSNTKTNVVIKS